jgi:hypothetical protein
MLAAENGHAEAVEVSPSLQIYVSLTRLALALTGLWCDRLLLFSCCWSAAHPGTPSTGRAYAPATML